MSYICDKHFGLATAGFQFSFMFKRRCQLAAAVHLALAWHLCLLVLPATQFQEIIDDVGQTSRCYKGHAAYPLSLLSSNRRGRILQELCRKELAQMHPNSRIQDAFQRTCCNGRRRGAHQSEYDFSFNERRIECKSSMVMWNKSDRRWCVEFARIKLPLTGVREQAPFDDLYLILLSPDRVDIIKHDLVTGISQCGQETAVSGHKIKLCGPRGVDCWKTARTEILDKLLGSACSLKARVDLSNPGLQSWLSQSLRDAALPQDEAYFDAPLNSMTSQIRGLRNLAY